MLTGLIVLFLIVGIILITMEVTKSKYQCDKPQIKYKYLPRTYQEELDNYVYPSMVYGKMFESSSPWATSFDLFPRRKLRFNENTGKVEEVDNDGNLIGSNDKGNLINPIATY